MTCRRFRETVVGATCLVSKLRNTEPGPEGLPDQIEDLLVTRYALQRHILLLDGAVDRVNSDLIYEHRLKGRFAGVALATDESPPKPTPIQGVALPDHRILLWHLSTSPRMGIRISSSTRPHGDSR